MLATNDLLRHRQMEEIMHKFYTLVAAIGLVMASVTVSSDLSYKNATEGADVIIVPGLVPGARTLTFKPSPKVLMNGMSTPISFAHDAVHKAALGTSGGQEYGMAADTNKVFFQGVDTDTSGAVLAIKTSDSTEFVKAGTAQNNWTQMK